MGNFHKIKFSHGSDGQKNIMNICTCFHTCINAHHVCTCNEYTLMHLSAHMRLHGIWYSVFCEPGRPPRLRTHMCVYVCVCVCLSVISYSVFWNNQKIQNMISHTGLYVQKCALKYRPKYVLWYIHEHLFRAYTNSEYAIINVYTKNGHYCISEHIQICSHVYADDLDRGAVYTTQ